MVNWRWQDYLALLIGIWVAASPWVLGFDGEHAVATWMAVIFGAAIVILAAIDLDAPSKIDEWGLIAVGVALMASPWILGFAEHRPAMTSMFLSGAAVAALTVWELLAHNGWGKPGDHAHGH